MFLFKSFHFLRDIKTNVLPSYNDHYLEFHHGVPAHLVSVGVRYWIHSNQLGFISNSDSVETWEDDCLRGSWETRWDESKGLCEVEEGHTPVYLCWFSSNYIFPCHHQSMCVFVFLVMSLYVYHWTNCCVWHKTVLLCLNGITHMV